MSGKAVANSAGLTRCTGKSVSCTGSAFPDPAAADAAKVGILVASVVAALLGAVVMRLSGRRAAAPAADPEPVEAPLVGVPG